MCLKHTSHNSGCPLCIAERRKDAYCEKGHKTFQFGCYSCVDAGSTTAKVAKPYCSVGHRIFNEDCANCCAISRQDGQQAFLSKLTEDMAEALRVIRGLPKGTTPEQNIAGLQKIRCKRGHELEAYSMICEHCCAENLEKSMRDVPGGPARAQWAEDLKPSSALDTQVGGAHYMDCAIQPVQFIEANQLGFLEGCVVKRVTRHNKPTGKGRQDVAKAIHELQLLLELRYGKTEKA